MLVVLVGCRGAGKTTALEAIKDKIKILQPSTTRPARQAGDAEYEFVDSWDPTTYAWTIKPKQHFYGMRKTEVDRAKTQPCITVFDPLAIDVQDQFAKSSPVELITIGLDTISDVAEQIRRVGSDPSRIMSPREFTDAREKVIRCDVVLRGSSDDIAEAIIVVAELLHGRGGVLVKRQIDALIRAGTLLTEGDRSAVRAASYDMRIGDQIWCQRSLVTLTNENPSFHLPPYSYAIVIAREQAHLPSFITGRFDLKVSMFLRGAILSNGPQIDPGYDGTLFCLLFNANSQPLPLTRDQQFATIEFTMTTYGTAKYNQRYALVPRLEAVLQQNVSNAGGTIMAIIETEMADIKSKIDRFSTTFWASIGVVNAALLSVFGGLAGAYISMLWDRVKDAEARVEKLKTIVEAAQTREEHLISENSNVLRAIDEARRKAIEAINLNRPDRTRDGVKK